MLGDNLLKQNQSTQIYFSFWLKLFYSLYYEIKVNYLKEIWVGNKNQTGWLQSSFPNQEFFGFMPHFAWEMLLKWKWDCEAPEIIDLGGFYLEQHQLIDGPFKALRDTTRAAHVFQRLDHSVVQAWKREWPEKYTSHHSPRTMKMTLNGKIFQVYLIQNLCYMCL